MCSISTRYSSAHSGEWLFQQHINWLCETSRYPRCVCTYASHLLEHWTQVYRQNERRKGEYVPRVSLPRLDRLVRAKWHELCVKNTTEDLYICHDLCSWQCLNCGTRWLRIAFNTKVGMIFPWLWLITTISVSTVRSVHLIRLSHDARNRKPYWVWIIKQKVSNNTTISLQGEPIHHQLVIIAETAFLPLVYIALARVNVI